jgi:hypothetical protein
MSRGGLWRNPDFLKLWAGQTVSQMGSMISREALPLTAVLVLGACQRGLSCLGAIVRRRRARLPEREQRSAGALA